MATEQSPPLRRTDEEEAKAMESIHAHQSPSKSKHEGLHELLNESGAIPAPAAAPRQEMPSQDGLSADRSDSLQVMDESGGAGASPQATVSDPSDNLDAMNETNVPQKATIQGGLSTDSSENMEVKVTNESGTAVPQELTVRRLSADHASDNLNPRNETDTGAVPQEATIHGGLSTGSSENMEATNESGTAVPQELTVRRLSADSSDNLKPRNETDTPEAQEEAKATIHGDLVTDTSEMMEVMNESGSAVQQQPAVCSLSTNPPYNQDQMNETNFAGALQEAAIHGGLYLPADTSENLEVMNESGAAEPQQATVHGLSADASENPQATQIQDSATSEVTTNTPLDTETIPPAAAGGAGDPTGGFSRSNVPSDLAQAPQESVPPIVISTISTTTFSEHTTPSYADILVMQEETMVITPLEDLLPNQFDPALPADVGIAAGENNPTDAPMETGYVDAFASACREVL